MPDFAANDFDAIRRKRDELRGGCLENSCDSTLDRVGQAYHVFRRPGEGDYAYRERVEAERRSGPIT